MHLKSKTASQQGTHKDPLARALDIAIRPTVVTRLDAPIEHILAHKLQPNNATTFNVKARHTGLVCWETASGIHTKAKCRLVIRQGSRLFIRSLPHFSKK